MKLKKLILGCVIGFNILGLIGCKSTEEITDEEIYEFEHRCKECHNEMTELYEDNYYCLYINCTNFTDPYEIYNKYPDLEYCFGCKCKEISHCDMIHPYVFNNQVVCLCDNGCVTEYKYVHDLPLTPDGDIVYCEECGNQVDPLEKEDRDLACCYEDIDNDGDYEYFHVGCYLTYTRLQPSRELLEYEHNEDEAIKKPSQSENQEQTQQMEPNIVTCDKCGRQGVLYEDIMRWYDTDGNNNFTHPYCLEDFIELTGKEPVQDLPNLE